MFLNRWKFVMACALFIEVPALAADLKDQLAYCSYVIEQAQAQRDLLRTPVAAAGITQPETGLPMQLVAGASLGLSGMKKAGLTMDAARTDCELYKAMTEAQQSIQYALSSLEKEALRNRLTLIDQASKSLDGLMEQTAKTVEAQNATRLMLFSLQTTKIRLDADRADTQSKVPKRPRNLYLPDYRAAFAFSQFRYPHRHRSALQLHYPNRGAIRTYPVPLRRHDRLGLPCTPAA